MTAYYKKQKIFFILLGVLAGLGAGALLGGPLLMLIGAAVGGLVGWRVFGSWANRKLKYYSDILFEKVEPERFLAEFGPVVEKMPGDSPDYVDGGNKLAYAHEAMGRFDQALAILDDLKPEKLKRRALGAAATTVSNRVRVLLLMENIPQAEENLDLLRQIAAAAGDKTPALGKSLQTYIRLYENWLLVLQGGEADMEYLALEVDRSLNRIRKSEIQLLLARAWEDQGDMEQADELRIETLSTGRGLWAETKARELLGVK